MRIAVTHFFIHTGKSAHETHKITRKMSLYIYKILSEKSTAIFIARFDLQPQMIFVEPYTEILK